MQFGDAGPHWQAEDAELGLRLLRQGLSAVYVDQVQGSGLVPADFAAYRRQRRRWAQGAMQTLPYGAALECALISRRPAKQKVGTGRTA